MAVRILVADHQKIVRAGLRALLEAQNGFVVVAEATNGQEAVSLARERKPDVIFMDAALPDMNGIETAARIRGEQAQPRIIALSEGFDKALLKEMFQIGVVGYLLKDCGAEELVSAVNAVMANKGYIAADVAPLILEDYAGQPLPAADVPHNDRLNPKETELLQFLANGLTAREIAERLRVSAKTVERNRAQLMDKLQLFSIAQLTKYAILHGISSLLQ